MKKIIGLDRWAFARIGLSTALLAGSELALSVNGVRFWRPMVVFAVLAIALVGFLEMILDVERPERRLSFHESNPVGLDLKDAAVFSKFQQMASEHGKLTSWVDDRAWDRQTRLVHWTKGLLEALIVIVLALGTNILANHGPDGFAVAEALRGQLSDCQTNLANSGRELEMCREATGTAQAKAAALEAKAAGLEAALAECRRQIAESADRGGGFNLTWGWVVIILVLIVVVGLLAKKHKEVVPLVGATGLATEAVKHSAELAKMNDAMYGALLNSYLHVSYALIGIFLVAAIVDLCKGPSTKQPVATPSADTDPLWHQVVKHILGMGSSKQSRSRDYLSSLGLSVVVLLWAAVMVGYKTPSAIQPPPPLKSQATLVPLSPTQRFSKMVQLENQEANAKALINDLVSKGGQDGDLLLLMGSTDCRTNKQPGGNDQLAKNRAKTVEKSLAPIAPPRLRIVTGSLDQAEKCAGAAQQMAVYPFLIKAALTKSGD